MENNMQQEETIDLGKLMQILYNRRKTVGTRGHIQRIC